MGDHDTGSLDKLLSLLFQAHPWHGISPGLDIPGEVNAFIEIVPTDTVKYELHKASGHLMIDRPQRYSSLCPTLYGFVPQTYCGPEVARRCEARIEQTGIVGDGDPLDICVLSERPIPHGNLLVRARPIGGLRLLDGDEADDKIIAVLVGDGAYGGFADLDHCPRPIIERLMHYFLSYKELPGTTPRRVKIVETYSRDEAGEVLLASLRDYAASFGAPERRIEDLRQLLGSSRLEADERTA
jgi:inorganic pyrophosphatase